MFGTELLERRVQIVDVTGGVRSFEIEVPSGSENATGRGEERGDVINVFEHMTEHDAVKSGHLRESRGGRYRSDIGFKATIAASGGAARRRIESGYCPESMVMEGSEQAARGAAGIEDAGGSRRQASRNVRGSDR